jgi:hypothetical protein
MIHLHLHQMLLPSYLSNLHSTKKMIGVLVKTDYDQLRRTIEPAFPCHALLQLEGCLVKNISRWYLNEGFQAGARALVRYRSEILRKMEWKLHQHPTTSTSGKPSPDRWHI